jgi:uncharacterized protein (DUF305 family)
MKRITTLLMGAGALALGACSGGEESGNNVTANTVAENGSANAMANDPNNPFAAAEMQMHERMTAAAGTNASETWVRKMIEHHRGAVQMSQILINQGGDPGFVQMARTGAEKQQREIGELERVLAGGVTGGSGEANPYGPVEQSMHQQMMAATGANLSQTWARKMIAHHQGAVNMSEVLIRQGGANPQVLALARRTAEDQRREIAHLEAMLRGEGMPAAGAPADTAAPPAPAAPAKAAGGDGAAAAPRPATPKASPAPRAQQPQQTAPRPAPKAEPSPTPKAECAPEHRAAGHC